LILFGLLFRSLKRLTTPAHAVVEQRLGNLRIEAQEVQDALMIILIFVGVVLFSWLPFLFYGFTPMDALFEVVSATGTVGLSSGITQAGLPTSLKLILCADMLLGRLEFVAWMVFFYPRTWFGRKRG
jgi:trk system potassium uptake protein TrkH